MLFLQPHLPVSKASNTEPLERWEAEQVLPFGWTVVGSRVEKKSGFQRILFF